MSRTILKVGHEGSDDTETTLASDSQFCRIRRLFTSEFDPYARFLVVLSLEIVSFAYGVERLQLESALVECGLRMVLQSDGSRSLLSHDDTLKALLLGGIAANACARVLKDNRTVLSSRESWKLIEGVIKPAEKLGIDPGYFLEKLVEYHTHRCVPGKETDSLLYKESSSPVTIFGRQLLSRKWLTGKQNKALKRRLLTDRLVVNRLGTTEESRVLILTAIAKFEQKYCRYDKQMTRMTYVDPVTTAVVETLRTDMLNKFHATSVRPTELPHARQTSGAAASGRASQDRDDRFWDLPATTRTLARGPHIPAPNGFRQPGRRSHVYQRNGAALRRQALRSFSVEDLRSSIIAVRDSDEEDPRAQSAFAFREGDSVWR
jgi:hypothetical protein